MFYVLSIWIGVKLSVSDFDGCKIGHIMGLFGGKENVAQKAFVVRHVSVIWIKISDADHPGTHDHGASIKVPLIY